ncbi:WLM-domain-containing protein [Aspergillus uvarum CBS 121591]|uniref:WLM-domain-containing protein n=1 Tax=Aspergillus uvarum CBS 121591 TaxID=1448315 RepID=A0A319CCP8_9EURO|nr:WLM-domain-containing protein [Aspergillus uvarum CBS 121591]PYH81471.1 WLM-domain-containing protein [Aspergillus uvarum CBS 121591]
MSDTPTPPVEDHDVREPDTPHDAVAADEHQHPQLELTIHHRNTPHTLTLPATATLHDLTLQLETHLNIPASHQKLLITPPPPRHLIPGTLKPPLPATQAALPLTTTLPLTSPRFKLTVLGSPTREITTLNAQGADQAAREQRRLTTHAQYAATATPSAVSSSLSRIHTISSENDTSQYTFHRLLPLPHLPNPQRSHDFLARLRDDPGIRSAMRIHKFSVPVLTEMDPVEHTTAHSRTLGLNRNKGEVIELRLRTDAYDGYRDYRTIRKTLCHELAHCVHSDHDRLFWELTGRIEREVERGDYTRSGRVLGANGPGGDEFYNPGEWEAVQREGLVVDEKGWTGGSFVLGADGGSSAGSSGQGTGGGGGGGSMREILAKAAEERMKRERERERDGQ